MGEKVVKAITQKYDGYQSSSKIAMKIDYPVKNKRFTQEFKIKLYNLCLNTHKKLLTLRGQMGLPHCGYNYYISHLKKCLAAYKVANCGELSNLTQAELINKGKTAYKLGFQIVPNEGEKAVNRTCDDHTFVVFGLKENADFSNPKTWGNKAVIVDTWGNVVAKADSAIRQFQTQFNLNPKVEHLEFSDSNLIPRKEIETIAQQNKAYFDSLKKQ